MTGLSTPSLSGAQRWHVVHTAPHREQGAAAQLRAQGYVVFLPKMLRTVRHARQLRTRLAPFFPRYLFIVLDPERDRWRSVNGTAGVSSLVMGADRPLPAPRGIVEALIARADAGECLRLDDRLQVGQSVRVMSGPFAEAVGRLSRLDSNDRVRVLLDILGGQTSVLLERAILVAA